MTNFIGEETNYILVRKHGDTEREEVVIYNDYNSSFSFTPEIERATLFDDEEKIKGLQSLQQSMADLMGSGHEFKVIRSEEHTSELQSRFDLVCRLLLEKKNK